MCMLLTCCTQTSFMILAAENKGLCRRACLNVLPLVCVPAWAPWTCWCSQTDISYHHLMLPRQWSPPETSGTDCPSVCPRRNGWRCCSLERRTKMKDRNVLRQLVLRIQSYLCRCASQCVFLLGWGPKQTSRAPSWSSPTTFLPTSTQNNINVKEGLLTYEPPWRVCSQVWIVFNIPVLTLITASGLALSTPYMRVWTKPSGRRGWRRLQFLQCASLR